MKKLLSILLILVLGAGLLASCGDKDTKSADERKELLKSALNNTEATESGTMSGKLSVKAGGSEYSGTLNGGFNAKEGLLNLSVNSGGIEVEVPAYFNIEKLTGFIKDPTTSKWTGSDFSSSVDSEVLNNAKNFEESLDLILDEAGATNSEIKDVKNFIYDSYNYSEGEVKINGKNVKVAKYSYDLKSVLDKLNKSESSEIKDLMSTINQEDFKLKGALNIYVSIKDKKVVQSEIADFAFNYGGMDIIGSFVSKVQDFEVVKPADLNEDEAMIKELDLEQ